MTEKILNPGDTKKKGGYIPDFFDDEEEDSEFHRLRRFYRNKSGKEKNKRWRKRAF